LLVDVAKGPSNADFLDVKELYSEKSDKASSARATRSVLGKTASNEVAKNIISEREMYISDLDAARIELTDDCVTLNKRIKDLTDTLETLEATRRKEKGEFEDAEAEMKAVKKAYGRHRGA
jgi:septal ring factor EnvC (AmiA/AmiB activator)